MQHIASDPRMPACSLAAQLAAIEADLGGRAGFVIDLSNPSDSRRKAAARGLPVLLAVASESGRVLRAWCPPCRAWHEHGRHGACDPGSCGCALHADLDGPSGVPCTCPVGAGNGARTPHCPPGSTFREVGAYYVREVPLSRLIWSGYRPPRRLEAWPPGPLLAECAAVGLSRPLALALWAAALEAAGRVHREARR